MLTGVEKLRGRVFLHNLVIALVLTVWLENPASADNELVAVRVGQAPVIDGSGNDPAWGRVPELEVWIKRPEHMREIEKGKRPEKQRVLLLAAHDGQRLYLLARWEDPTADHGHKTWRWSDEKGAYVDSGDREDRFAIEFPLGESFHACMLGGEQYEADVWHWKACRSNPAGYAHDKHHRIGITRQSKQAARWKTKNGYVYIERSSDEGQNPYREQPAPQDKAEPLVPKYVAQTPTGSQADVVAKGRHDGAGWTLELSRALDTGHRDDTAFDPTRTYRFAIAVFDREGDEDHSTSGELILRFSDKDSMSGVNP